MNSPYRDHRQNKERKNESISTAGDLLEALGLSQNFTMQSEQGMVIYDALYSWLKHAQGERTIGFRSAPQR